MKTHTIEISRLVMPKGRRALRQNTVADLVESIGRIGLRTPISIRMVNGTPHLITGRHRVEAVKARGQTDIAAHIFDDDASALIWEIDENLQRADLTKQERMEHRAMRVKLYEERASKLQAQAETGRYEARADAQAAGQKYFYPAEACPRGHAGMRYVSTTHCVTCERARNESRRAARASTVEGVFAKTQSSTTAKLAHNAPVTQSAGGRGRKGGNRESARRLGVSKDTIRRAKIFDKLKPGAKTEAIRLGIANKHQALRYAAAHDTEALQIRALNSQVRVMAEKEERKRRAEMTVREQAAAAVGAEPRVIARIEHAREATTAYWLWLIEEFGERAYQVINRLREVDLRLLLEIADSAKAEGAVPKPRLH